MVQLAKDAPANVTEWSAETARRFVKTMYIGIEIASSPLQNINDFGPAVVASDFGNNAGLLLGAEIVDWQTRPLETMNCETRIDGNVVGRGSAAAVSGGPLTALAFALRVMRAAGVRCAPVTSCLPGQPRVSTRYRQDNRPRQSLPASAACAAGPCR